MPELEVQSDRHSGKHQDVPGNVVTLVTDSLYLSLSLSLPLSPSLSVSLCLCLSKIIVDFFNLYF